MKRPSSLAPVHPTISLWSSSGSSARMRGSSRSRSAASSSDRRSARSGRRRRSAGSCRAARARAASAARPRRRPGPTRRRAPRCARPRRRPPSAATRPAPHGGRHLEGDHEHIADGGARLECTRQGDDRDALLARGGGQLAPRRGDDAAGAERAGRLERGERLLRVAGVARAQHRRVGRGPRRHAVVAHHDRSAARRGRRAPRAPAPRRSRSRPCRRRSARRARRAARAPPTRRATARRAGAPAGRGCRRPAWRRRPRRSLRG